MLKIVREKLETVGIIVMMNGVVGSNTHRSLNIDEFRAFTLVDEYAPLIFINAHDSNNGRLFSLFHEIAHIWFGTNSLFNDRYCIGNQKTNEVKCNAIAAELILPNKLFVESWSSKETEEIESKIRNIAKEFHCGMTVVARRALDNNFITQEEYKKHADIARELYKQSKGKVSSGGNYFCRNNE